MDTEVPQESMDTEVHHKQKYGHRGPAKKSMDAKVPPNKSMNPEVPQKSMDAEVPQKSVDT